MAAAKKLAAKGRKLLERYQATKSRPARKAAKTAAKKKAAKKSAARARPSR